MSSTNTDRRISLSERLKQIRQQRRALEELTSKDHSEHEPETSVSCQSSTKRDDSARASRLSNGWARSERGAVSDTLSLGISAEESAVSSAQIAATPPTITYTVSAPSKALITDQLPVDMILHSQSSNQSKEARVSGDLQSHRCGRSAQYTEGDDDQDCQGPPGQLSPTADGVSRRRSLRESRYNFEHECDNQSSTVTTTAEQYPHRVSEERSPEQLQETPMSYLDGAQDDRGDYLNSSSSGRRSFSPGKTVVEALCHRSLLENGAGDSDESSIEYHAKDGEQSTTGPMYSDERITEGGEYSESYEVNCVYRDDDDKDGPPVEGQGRENSGTLDESGRGKQSEYEVKYEPYPHDVGYGDERPQNWAGRRDAATELK